jgi:hypothetical protein
LLKNNLPQFVLLFYHSHAEHLSLYTRPVKRKHWSSKLALNVIEERSKASFGRLSVGPFTWSRRSDVYNDERKTWEPFAEVISDEILGEIDSI